MFLLHSEKKGLLKKKVAFIIGTLFIAAIAAALFIWDRGMHVYISEDIKIGEEVRFKSKGLTISGSLVKPDTDDPTSAIIAIIGAGDDTYRQHWDENYMMPIWKPIVETLNGELVPGEILPPERKLAQQLGVSRSTVTLAYEELRSTGLLQSHQGGYTKVSDHHWGITTKRIPNWYAYTNGGSFLPNLPILKRIRENYLDSINLSLGELADELLPNELMSEIIRNFSMDTFLSYPDPQGLKDLRETLSVHLNQHYRIAASPDEILITSGGHQALLLITQCLLTPGDAVAIEGPSYAYSLPLFNSAGLRLFKIPLDEQGLVPEELISIYRKHRVKMVFTNPTYQNPTGTILSISRRKKLLEICEELRIPIVKDDPYRSLTLEGSTAPPPPLRSLNQGKELVLYVGSMSKDAAPGFRIGWIVAPKNVIKRLADAKYQMDFGTSMILQEMANQYFLRGMWEQQLKRVISALTIRRDLLLSALSEHLDDYLKWNIPTGGYHVWCRIKHSVNIERLLDFAILKKTLFLPGIVMGAESGYLRLT